MYNNTAKNIKGKLFMVERVLELDISKYVDLSIYVKNQSIVNDLNSKVLRHKIFSEESMWFFNCQRSFSEEQIKIIFYDYKYSIVQIFTDALLALALSSSELETVYELPEGAKIIPRLLLTPNFIDEFGCNIENGRLHGSVNNAHYPLFETVLKKFPACDVDIELSNIAVRTRNFLEKYFNDYSSLAALLAVAEYQVIYFTPILEKILTSNNKTREKYFIVHGTTDENSSESLGFDDEHADDLWVCLSLIANKVDCEELVDTINQYLDLWQEFWNYQFKRFY